MSLAGSMLSSLTRIFASQFTFSNGDCPESAHLFPVGPCGWREETLGGRLVTLGGGEFGCNGDGGADWEGWLWVRMPLVSLHPDSHVPLTRSFLQQFRAMGKVHLVLKTLSFRVVGLDSSE